MKYIGRDRQGVSALVEWGYDFIPEWIEWSVTNPHSEDEEDREWWFINLTEVVGDENFRSEE